MAPPEDSLKLQSPRLPNQDFAQFFPGWSYSPSSQPYPFPYFLICATATSRHNVHNQAAKVLFQSIFIDLVFFHNDTADLAARNKLRGRQFAVIKGFPGGVKI
jgi:hypothetical protein